MARTHTNPLDELALAADDDEGEAHASLGKKLLRRWMFSRLGQSGTRHVLAQFALFYMLLAVGFLFLYIMFKSTQQIRSGVRNLKRNVGETLRAQHARRFDLDDYRASPWI